MSAIADTVAVRVGDIEPGDEINFRYVDGEGVTSNRTNYWLEDVFQADTGNVIYLCVNSDGEYRRFRAGNMSNIEKHN